MIRRHVVAGLAAWAVTTLLTPGGAAAQETIKKVDCDQGKTIMDVLEQAEYHEMTILVSGVCQENVVITRDRVTIIAEHPGAGVNGPNAQASTILVRGSQITIDGLTVTGGSSGIVGIGANQLVVRNCSVTAPRNGIAFVEGANGSVDACRLDGNGRDGIQIGESSMAGVTNSSVSGNARFGILVYSGGTGRIGLTVNQVVGGNTINGNRSAGIQVTARSSANIAGNTISGNGFLPNNTAGQLPFGVSVFHSQADLAGNTITGNAGSGVVVTHGAAVIGPLVGSTLNPTNVINGNGSVAFPNAQVFVTQGAGVEIRFAQITGAGAPGVSAQLRAVMNIFGGTISNTAGNAIEIGTGAGLSFQAPPVTLTATGFGLQCFGTEASFLGVPVGTISPTCTGF